MSLFSSIANAVAKVANAIQNTGQKVANAVSKVFNAVAKPAATAAKSAGSTVKKAGATAGKAGAGAAKAGGAGKRSMAGPGKVPRRGFRLSSSTSSIKAMRLSTRASLSGDFASAKLQPVDVSKDRGEHGLWCGATHTLERGHQVESFTGEATSFLKKLFDFDALTRSGGAAGPSVSQAPTGIADLAAKGMLNTKGPQVN